MYKRVLVPLDGSNESHQALSYATLIANATGADLELIEAVESVEQLSRIQAFDLTGVGTVSTNPAPEGGWERFQQSLREQAEGRLANAAQGIAGITVRHKVVEGDPTEAILTEATGKPDTLVAMASHGRSGIGRWTLGSVTDKVVRHAPVPVMVVRSREGQPAQAVIKGIVLPLDGSELAEKAMPTAVALSTALGVGISVVRAKPTPPYVLGTTEGFTGIYREYVDDMDAVARDYLRRTAQLLKQERVAQVAEVVVDGDAAHAILEEAGEDCVVVMTTHGRTGIGRWVLGSVADRVVSHSQGPVLIIRPRG